MVAFEKIYYDVIQNLGYNLADYYHYHSVRHTIYVEKMACYLAKKMGVADHDLYLLRVAALYHDSGFLVQAEDHEEISCEMVESELPKYNLTNSDIEKVKGMIRATKIPQKPQNCLEEILADADLEYLSTENFDRVSSFLFKELQYFEPNLTLEEWDTRQIHFLENHQYHTEFCRKNKENFKQQHLRKLKEKYSLS
ncbi:HD domain-containing protein [Jiulongibacter sediminis]|jgi:uncharacterized protein|uniref:HD domain-containing protein n=1 Tax=Jiulongibacter sediminis TaxID=1605367 RepID=UPI0026EBADE5|nr:HD domain-containing protein [Jiulongibacter sediminis]